MIRFAPAILLLALAGCGMISHPELARQAAVSRASQVCSEDGEDAQVIKKAAPDAWARQHAMCLDAASTATPDDGSSTFILGPAGMGGTFTISGGY